MTNILNFAIAQGYGGETPLNNFLSGEIGWRSSGRSGTYKDKKGNEVLLTQHTEVGRMGYSADIYSALEVADVLVYPYSGYSYGDKGKSNEELLNAFGWALDYRKKMQEEKEEKEMEEKEEKKEEEQQEQKRKIILCVQIDSQKKYAKEVLFTEPRLVGADYKSNKHERFDVYMVDMNTDYVVYTHSRRTTRSKKKNKKDDESSKKEKYNGLKLENLAKGFADGLIDFCMNKDEEDKAIIMKETKKGMKGFVNIHGEKKSFAELKGVEIGKKEENNTTKNSSYSFSFFNSLRGFWSSKTSKTTTTTTTTTTNTTTESTNNAVALSA